VLNYRLVIITNGRVDCLTRTLESFKQMVRPRPKSVVMFDDGEASMKTGGLPDWTLTFGLIGTYLSSKKPVGFCGATRAAWAEAAKPGADFIYWLEDDFLHKRAVDLIDLAVVLQNQPQLTQMAFVRNPVNSEEIEAGGYINLRPDAYIRRGDGGMKWLEHTFNWTTNPALIPRRVLVENEWPVEEQCEGKFGFQIRADRPGATFGLWGNGEEWVEHFCDREGFGY
jgi:hypothetical protein